MAVVTDDEGKSLTEPFYPQLEIRVHVQNESGIYTRPYKVRSKARKKAENMINTTTSQPYEP